MKAGDFLTIIIGIISQNKLMLMQQGYLPIDVKFADRKRYYACFDSYYKDKTAAPMVEMVAGYLEERLKRYLDILL